MINGGYYNSICGIREGITKWDKYLKYCLSVLLSPNFIIASMFHQITTVSRSRSMLHKPDRVRSE